MKNCYCGNNIEFKDCCKPYLLHVDVPLTAEALLRSRYTAFVTNDIEYIKLTSSKKIAKTFSESTVQSWALAVNFTGLEILNVEQGLENDTQGIVEFKAHFTVGDIPQIHFERCLFIKEEGLWFYDGTLTLKERAQKGFKISLNDLCLCGSGKKFEACCGKTRKL